MDITTLLREKGFKVTPQRLAVYSVLAESKEHPSAEMIYNKLSPLYPTMSLATVYKTLEILVDANIIQEINVGENSFRYDARTNPHPHVTCISCNRVDDIEEGLFNDIDERIASNTNYSIQKHQLYFFGHCPECKSKSKTIN